MATVQEHLKLQMEKIKESLPKQILEEDSSGPEDPDDSLRDPDYQPEGESSESESNQADEPQAKKKKNIKPAEGICRNVDENNNSNEEDNNTSSQDENVESCEQISSQDENVESCEQSVGQCKKKRKVPQQWKSAVRKRKRNRGQEYENTKGNVVPEKVFKHYDCLCPLKCTEQVPVESRKKNFDAYYGCGSWEMQTSFISGHIKSVDVDRRYGKGSLSKSRRQKSRYYYLDTDNGARRVCKAVFMKTLDINSARIHRALIKMQSGCLTDLRGKHKAWNKTEESSKAHVMQHIGSFPTYSSHYCRSDSERKYLSPDLSLNKMYELYEILCKDENLKPVCKTLYVAIFHTEFNYSFKTPSKDACKTCDKLNTQIRSETIKPESKRNNTKLENDQTEHKEHLEESQNARNTLNNDKVKPNSDKTTCVITFDLQKTLPTPKIPTGVAYYKRQLWVYNFGVHSYQNDDEHVLMYMWHEGISSRGAQEVSSCLKDFVMTKLPADVKHLMAWSDSCGGQDRNIKVCAMWMHLLEVSQLESIDHKFLESGHSYLPCDSDFGDIEKYAKRFEHVYCPDDWYNLVRKSRSKHPFQVIEMQTSNFVSTAGLQKAFINRKKDENGEKVQWLKMKHIHFEKQSPMKLYYKYSHMEETFKRVNLEPKKTVTHMLSEDLPLLNPHGRAITKEKRIDLKALLPYVPPIHHPFYRSLRAHADVVDDINGNSIDYEME